MRKAEAFTFSLVYATTTDPTLEEVNTASWRALDGAVAQVRNKELFLALIHAIAGMIMMGDEGASGDRMVPGSTNYLALTHFIQRAQRLSHGCA